MAWTTYKGEPVYWLAPEFWNPKTGVVRLVLPGENPAHIPVAESMKRGVEFLKLQGDGRYCSPDEAARMKTIMRQRLGSDTPWRDVPPVNSQEPDGLPDPGYAQPAAPFA